MNVVPITEESFAQLLNVTKAVFIFGNVMEFIEQLFVGIVAGEVIFGLFSLLLFCIRVDPLMQFRFTC